MIEKMVNVVLLKDFYGPLLTVKQQDILSLYYEQDLSLSEIANNMEISRQAIFDILKRAELALETYEKKLGLVEKYQVSKESLLEIYQLLNDDFDKNNIEQVKIKILKIVEQV